MSKLQHVIVCCQQTKIGKAREDWSSQKVCIFGQILFIFAKVEKNWNGIFIRPVEELSCWKCFKRSIGSAPTPLKNWLSGAFSFFAKKNTLVSHTRFFIQTQFHRTEIIGVGPIIP